MLIMVLFVSILSGAASVGAAEMLNLPFWATILSYPLGGMLGLLAAAVFASREQIRLRPARSFAAPARQPQQS